MPSSPPAALPWAAHLPRCLGASSMSQQLEQWRQRWTTHFLLHTPRISFQLQHLIEIGFIFFLISLFFVAHNPFLVKGSFLSNLFLHLGLCKTMQHATPLSSSWQAASKGPLPYFLSYQKDQAISPTLPALNTIIIMSRMMIYTSHKSRWASVARHSCLYLCSWKWMCSYWHIVLLIIQLSSSVLRYFLNAVLKVLSLLRVFVFSRKVKYITNGKLLSHS